MVKRFLGALMLLPVLAAAAGTATLYPIDRNHTTIGFDASIMKLSKVTGKFADFKGVVIVPDARDLTTSSIMVTMRSASISTGLPDRDKDLRSPGWFDTDKYPEVAFKSKTIRKGGPPLPLPGGGPAAPSYIVSGTFTMHGVTKEISFPASVSLAKKVFAAEAHFPLNRRDYGINWGRPMEDGSQFIDDDVQIDLYLLTKVGQPYQLGAPIPETEPGR
jgi:polyisoprenoid-binding protein YceI